MRPLKSVVLMAAVLVGHVPGAEQPDIAAVVGTLTRTSNWTAVAAIRVGARMFHPQGMVKIGDEFFVSSVEVTEAPERFDRIDAAGFDRTPGAGTGHLFRLSPTGHLLADLVIGEGTLYHPGGIDFDGRYIWVAVAEYRPHSRSIVYRVDPATMRSLAVLRVSDHLGAVAVDSEQRTLHAMNWGSRRFYRWPLPTGASTTALGITPLPPHRENPSHYVDYQDCQFVGRQRMLCTGIARFGSDTNAEEVVLGGLDIVSLDDARPLAQMPVTIRTPAGHVLTQNPSYVELTPTGLRAYFMPDDDDATIYVYDITP